jgi:dienelactone hydrolase
VEGGLRLSGYREPLGLWRHRVGPPLQSPSLRVERIEFSSRGDRACGRLWLPRRADGELPVVLLGHDADGCAASAELEAVAAQLALRGAAVAALDLPLHGARGDGKLGARLARALAGGRDPAPAALVEEFARQAVVDLERALDALGTLPELDAGRVGYAGFGVGAQLGAAFCGLDARVCGAALCLSGGSAPAGELDARGLIARIAPRPLLLVAPERGEVASARALFEAAREPKQELRLAGARAGDAVVIGAIERFLAPLLRLSAA